MTVRVFGMASETQGDAREPAGETDGSIDVAVYGSTRYIRLIRAALLRWRPWDMRRKAWYFLGLTFGVTWIIEGVAIRWIGDFSTLNDVGTGLGVITLIFIGCMYVPAVAVVVVQKGMYGDSLRSLGVSFRINGWWAVAVLLPIGVAAGSIGVSLLWPDVGLSSGKVFLLEQLEAASLPPDQIEEAKRSIEEGETILGPTLAVLLFGVALVAGPTINGLAAFGEEFGWRGFLQNELASVGFWRSSLGIGVIWGLWYLPLILGGYNYPGMPVKGLGMMILFTVAWSPVQRIRGGAGSVRDSGSNDARDHQCRRRGHLRFSRWGKPPRDWTVGPRGPFGGGPRQWWTVVASDV